MNSNAANLTIPNDIPNWELFPHESDMGLRGFGKQESEAFEQAAIALTAMVTNPALVKETQAIEIKCKAKELDLLLMDWLNAIIFEMATKKMLFHSYQVEITKIALEFTLQGKINGEPINIMTHSPAVEPKAATFSELKVLKLPEAWVAQCVIDV